MTARAIEREPWQVGCTAGKAHISKGDDARREWVAATLGKAVEALRHEGANIVCVLTIVDRLEGATENFAAQGLELRALYTADEFLKA